MSESDFKYKNKRILQIIPNMEIGGAERTVLEITNFLKETNFLSMVLTSGGKLINDLEKANIEVIKLPIDKKNPYSVIKNFFIFTKIFREKKIDLVHVRSRGPAWSAIFAAKRIGIPVLTTWHGHVSNSSFLKKIYNSIMLKGDAVIANSSYTAKRISKIYNLDINRIDIVSRGVDVKSYELGKFSKTEIDNIKKLWSIDNNKRIILFPARLTRWKGHLVTIEAINFLKKEKFFNETIFVFAGEKSGAESYVKKLDSLIEKYKLQKNIKLVERIENMQLAYQASEIVLSPSIEPEPFGRIPIETQAAGKTIIASDHGAVKDTIISGDSFTGFKVKPNDPLALSEAIKKSILMDGKDLNEMHDRAVLNVKNNFSLESMCKKTLEVYKRLLISE